MLDEIKDCIEYSYNYFKKNHQRYHNFMRFIYDTSLSPADRSVLQELSKPMVEFNVLEAYISRLCGEFSKMDPAFSVRAKEGIKLIDPQIISLVEAHMKAAFTGAHKDGLAYQLYKDILGGGYSVAKIYTDYADSMSMEQKIYVERVFDPTLCGFDPLARATHKGDGRYAFECFPKSVDEAEKLYGSDVAKGMDFVRSPDIKDFNWSYKNQSEDIILFAEFYKRKKRKTKIVKLTNGHVVSEKTYAEFLAKYEEAGMIEQPPQIIKSRMTEIESIDKYTICGNQVVLNEETDFNYLPLVFFDGNSVMIRDNDHASAEQMTRPYIYQARDAQKMKNFAGQTLCNEIENLVQHKWIAPIEAIPDNEDYKQAYIFPQKASVILHNSFMDGDPEKPINPPREVARVPIPPEISATFAMADQVIQGSLGSYDAALGINDNDISGVAIMQGAMHSNAAAMPYTMGFIQGWNRLGEVYLDLLPKYYVTPRSIPIITSTGKHEYYIVNAPGSVSFDYDASALEVSVEAGVNFAVQKQVALKTIIALMQASQQFNQFMNTNGLEILLDNIDIRGIENLKAMAGQFMQQQAQIQAQAQQQQAQQPTPEQIQMQQLQLAQQQIQSEAQVGMAKVQQAQQEAELNAQVDMTRIATDNALKAKESDIRLLDLNAKYGLAGESNALQQQKIDAENARTAIEMAMKVSNNYKEQLKTEGA